MIHKKKGKNNGLTPLLVYLKSQKQDKRAWLRIFEAFVAIMMLLGFFLAIMIKQQPKSTASEEMYNLEKQLLEEIASNITLRSAVIRQDVVPLKIFVYGRLPPYFDYDLLICTIFSTNCQLATKPNADVYANDILISSNLTNIPESPLMLRLFLWSGKPSLPPEVTPPVEPPVEPPFVHHDCLVTDLSGAAFDFIFESEACMPAGCKDIFYKSLTASIITLKKSFYTEYCSEGATDCTFTGCPAIDSLMGKDVANPSIGQEKSVCVKKSDGMPCKMKIRRTV